MLPRHLSRYLNLKQNQYCVCLLPTIIHSRCCFRSRNISVLHGIPYRLPRIQHQPTTNLEEIIPPSFRTQTPGPPITTATCFRSLNISAVHGIVYRTVSRAFSANQPQINLVEMTASLRTQTPGHEPPKTAQQTCCTTIFACHVPFEASCTLLYVFVTTTENGQNGTGIKIRV